MLKMECDYCLYVSILRLNYFVFQASAELRFASKYIYNQQICTNIHNSIVGVANVLPTMICAASYDIVSVGCTVSRKTRNIMRITKNVSIENTLTVHGKLN